MARIEISIALTRAKSAFLKDIEGRESTKRCVCIPVDELSVDKNGTIWLNFTGYDDTKFERQTHSLKQKLTKTQYEALPTDESGKRALMPYCGTVKTAEQSHADPQTASAPASYAPNPDDLPF